MNKKPYYHISLPIDGETMRGFTHRSFERTMISNRLNNIAHDFHATRAWFAGREAGWTPAERVRRAAANASEIWAL